MSGNRRLEHVGIGVSRDNYEATLAFYERVFGWRRIREVPDDFTFLSDGQGGRIEVLLRDGAAPLGAPHHLAIVVARDDFEATTAALREAGAQFDQPITNATGDRLLYFTDPAGNYAQIVGRVTPLAP